MASSAVIEGLNKSLASATVFYQKLRAFHWMVKGPQFFMLHEEFEKLYDRWADVIDELAERIVMLGGTPQLTLKSVLETSALSEETSSPPAAKMVELVVADLHAQHEAFRSLIDTCEKAGDRTTTNLLDGIADEMDKTLWMLRATLEG